MTPLTTVCRRSAPSAGFARATEASGGGSEGGRCPPPSVLADGAGLVHEPDVVGGYGDADAAGAEGLDERLV